jgi:putative SOS response-associated peptidase YedK
MKGNGSFFMAGLFSVWKDLPTFTIITTQANKLMSAFHHRMPVIMPEKHFEQWLDPDFKDTDRLKKLLLPYPASKMEAFKVSSYVSNSRNEGEKCMEKVE